MNSFVNIQVQVLAAQAQAQLAQINTRLAGLEGSMNKNASAAGRFGSALGRVGLDSFGSKVQWAGRQLEYNFTLPILAAGGAAMKMALDNQAAMTRISKVYGDATHDATFYKKEIESLKGTFEQLSNTYGINQAEVLGIAASWAAAGASGIALAKSVDLTMQTMILGEMDAAEATKALISIQAQYGFGVADLTKTIATLNMVENQTGISLEGLVQGFERSAGVARSVGVDVRHLAAMLASLVPASGSAAQAGNALKTIFSRLISPTAETTEVLDLMGIKITDMSWKSATMTDRLITMAKKFEGLSSSQKGVVSSVAASRWQVNKFEVLMRDLINTNGYYQRALQATSKETDVFNQMNKELTAVLTSNPRKLQIIWTMLKNAMTDIIIPMIPLILYLAESVEKLVTGFSNLPQPIQLTILGLLGFMAIMGPLVRIFGAAALMAFEVGRVFGLLLVPIKAVGGALMFLFKTPVMFFLNSLGFLARGGVVAFYYLTVGVKAALAGLQIALLTGAAIAGRIWAAGMGAMATISGAAMATIGVIWRRAMVYLRVIAATGMLAVNAVMSVAYTALFAIQRAWIMVSTITWSKFFVALGTIVSGGFTAIAALFSRFIVVIRSFSGAAVAALTGPWGIAIGLIIALLVGFWDELKALWGSLVRGTIKAFYALPEGIQGAMMSVVNVVRGAVMAVYKLFSYLNPWAHHSPSLVENVTTGMTEIEKQFNRAKGMTGIFKSAYNDLQRFGKALAILKAKSDAAEFSEMRKNIRAIDPGAIASYDRLVKILPKLKNLLASLKPALDAQAAAVAKWKDKLDAANAVLDVQTQKLNKLEKVANDYQNALSAAQSKLDSFVNAPIKGMKEMEDAIFDNEMQQKKLRLELMKMEEAVGPMDQLQSRIESINGQIELLRGQQTDLRNAGAGSEILSQYDAQIALLEDQQDAINAQLAPMQNLSNQIDELGRKAEMLDLENSLKFDPLKKQIDDVSNSMKELPFDEILDGVIKNKAEVDRLTEAYNKAKAAVDKQQGVVDQYTQQKDAIQARYDAENNALQKLQKEYDNYESQIRDIEQAMRDAGSAADALARASKGAGSMSPGAENFKAGAGGNFPDPGGFADIGREGGIPDQSKLIDDFTKEMADKTKNMFGVFSFLDPIKKAWNTAWSWLKTNLGPAFSELGSSIGGAFDGLNPFDGVGSWIDTIKELWSSVKQAFGFIWRYIGPEVIKGWKNAWNGIKDAFKDIQPEIAKFRELVGPMGEALGNIWKMAKPGLTIILGLIMAIVKGLVRGLGGAIGPIIRGIGDLIAGIIKIVRGLIEFIVGVFTLDWKMAWQGIVTIFSGIWQAIAGVIVNAFNAIWGLLKGFVTGFIGFFVQLYDELVGHSIVPDMVNAIIAWIASLPGKAWEALKDFGGKIVDVVKTAWEMFKAANIAAWSLITSWLKGRAQAAWNAIITIKDKLKDAASQGMEYFKIGLGVVWEKVKTWFQGRKDAVVGYLTNIKDGLKIIATTAIGYFKDGASIAWNKVKDFFSGRYQAIKNAIGNVSLYEIGKSILTSLLDGLKNAWNKTKDFLSGLGQQIKNLKGPIEKDRKLLIPEGEAIMNSLGLGMRTEWSGVEGWLSGVSRDIQNTMTASKALDNALAATASMNTYGSGNTALRNENSGTRVINFYGDLEFPNVTDGADAEEFLLNLEAMVRG